MNDAAEEQQILDLEREALDRWCKGDPSGFLDISAPDVVYFDPFIDRRIDGLEALAAYYEGLRGQISASKYEIISPRVQFVGAGAVLTFNFVSWGGNENEYRWNCTEVYKKTDGQWKIVQTHWSMTRPFTGS